MISLSIAEEDESFDARFAQDGTEINHAINIVWYYYRGLSKSLKTALCKVNNSNSGIFTGYRRRLRLESKATPQKNTSPHCMMISIVGS
jgi:hypothetical protein